MQQFVRQLVGLAILVAFFWVSGFIHGFLRLAGWPDWLAWVVGVIGAIVLAVGVVAAFQAVPRWWYLRKPGVRAVAALDKKAFELHKKGDLAGAQPLYEQSLAQAELSKDPAVIGLAANNLAGLYWDLERNGDAAPLFQRAYDLRKQALGADDELTLVTAERLSQALGKLDQWAEVERLQRELLPIYRQKTNDGNAAAETWDAIGIACRHQGKYDQADEAYREEESMLTKSHGLETPTARQLYNDWGYLMNARGRPVDALPLYEKARAIAEQSGDKMALGSVLENLAEAQSAVGDRIGAAQTADRMMATIDELVAEKTGSNESLALHEPLVAYARYLEAAGRTHDAGAARSRADAIRAAHPNEITEPARPVAGSA